MAAPGFSISELISAGLVCKTILGGFIDKYSNSSARIINLATNISALCAGLERHKEMLERRGSTYEGYESFKLTLDECEDFISKYKVLLDKKRNHPAAWWQTAKFTFEGDNVNRLQAQIASQMNVMHMSFMNIFIENNLQTSETKNISISEQSPRKVAGEIPQQSSPPPALPAKLPLWSPSTSPSSGGYSQTGPLSSASSYRSSIGSTTSLTIGEICFVTIDGGFDRVKLDRMPVIQKHDRSWDIVLLNSKNKPKFRHHIGAPYDESSHPYTEHSYWKRPPHVKFIDPPSEKPVEQYITVSRKNKPDEKIFGSVKYTFVDPKTVSDPNEAEYLKSLFFDFQGIIFGKTLRDVFNFENINTRRGMESSIQQLKAWSDPITCAEPDAYISFFANGKKDGRHLEFPVSCFDEDVECEKEKIVKVYFTSSSKKPGREKSQATRANTFQSQSTEETAAPSIFSEKSPTMTTGTPSVFSGSTQTPISPSEMPVIPVGCRKMKYLKISFSSRAEATRFQNIWGLLKYEADAPSPKPFTPVFNDDPFAS